MRVRELEQLLGHHGIDAGCAPLDGGVAEAATTYPSADQPPLNQSQTKQRDLDPGDIALDHFVSDKIPLKFLFG